MLSVFKLGRLFILLVVVVSTIACEDDLGLDEWSARPDTVTLYSLSRPDLINQPSAYDFVNHLVVRVESPSATGTWDVALRDEGNGLALVPAGGFQGLSSRAALSVITNRTFEELREAPEDTARFTSGPVVVQAGQVLAVRTRRAGCAFTTSVRYGKIKIIDVNPAAGTVRFAAIVNPFCNDRSLIPPNDD
jgi:hypothetical protein